MKCIYCSAELEKGKVELDMRYRPKYHSDEEIESKSGVNSFLKEGISISRNHGIAWRCPQCKKVFLEFVERESMKDKLHHMIDKEK